MDQLGRYPLAAILSYLSEIDGTCLLLTRKQYARDLLPVFRLPSSIDPSPSNKNDCFAENLRVIRSTDPSPSLCPHTQECQEQHHQQQKRKFRHRFVEVPVQDAAVLLARLNTRRWYRRRKQMLMQRGVHWNSIEMQVYHGLSTTELAKLEWNLQRREQEEDKQLDLEEDSRPLLRFLSFPTSPFAEAGTTLLVSYPRSGNSLARSLLEQTTGIVTGSDSPPNYDLSRELAQVHDLVGEGIVSNRLVNWIKTHWPERRGSFKPIDTARRAIVLTRNPYDAIDSYWNMCATKSHTQTVTDAVYDRFQVLYEDLVRNEISVWLRFHHYWMTEAAVAIPILLVRYEDLVQQPQVELRRMLEFSLGEVSLSAYWTRRIKHVTDASRRVEQLGSYRPRGSSPPSSSISSLSPSSFSVKRRIGQALRRRHMSEELVHFIHETSERFPVNYLKQFGYDVLHDMFPTSSPSVQVLQRVFNISDSVNKLTIQHHEKSNSTTWTINAGCTVRPFSCRFGRGMRDWRRSVTNKDQNPLPTITSSFTTSTPTTATIASKSTSAQNFLATLHACSNC